MECSLNWAIAFVFGANYKGSNPLIPLFMLNIFLLCFVNIFVIFSVIMTIFTKNLVFSLFFLVLTFLFSSILLLIFNCEFLAFIFLIVYAGGITVLFLFAIMLLDFKFKDLTKNTLSSILNGSVFVFLFFCCLIPLKNYNVFFVNPFYKFAKPFNFVNWVNLNYALNDVEIFSLLLYTNFILPFLLIGFILLLVLINVAFLTNNYVILNFKTQLHKQTFINFNYFFNN